MLLTLSQVLDADNLLRANTLIDGLAWSDGRRTAGGMAAEVKRNRQADLSSPAGEKVRGLLESALLTNPIVKAAAIPKRLSKLLISETDPGGGYGLHVDNAFMGAGADRLRTDLAFTLFLSTPDTYDGGGLTLEHTGERRTLKEAAGDMILYPASSLHQVDTVTRGTRRVCVGWIESAVKDPMARETLFDLTNLSVELAASRPADAPERLVLAKSIANLMRLFGT